ACSTSSCRANSAAVASGSAPATSRSEAPASSGDVDRDGEVAVDARRDGARPGGCALIAAELSHGRWTGSAGPRYGAKRANVPLRLDQTPAASPGGQREW